MKTLDTRLKDNLRRRLSKTLKDTPRTKKAHELLGCGMKHFKRHIESLFLPGMDWSNYGGGIYGWELDHEIPLMNFNMTKISHQKKAFHYKNTRPLWVLDNRQRKKKFNAIEEFKCGKNYINEL